MSQHDLNIANQGFPAFRADLNDALLALGSTNSGATAPATTFANQLWYDTANNILKIRNEDNDAWISIVTLDQSADTVSAITAATVNAGALNATGNVVLGDASTDTLNVGNGGLVKDASGNVIVGGTSSAGKFTVTNGLSFLQKNGAGTQESLKLDNSDTTAGTQTVKLSFSSSGSAKASITSAVYGNGYMAFATNDDTEKMRINANANIVLKNGSVGADGVGITFPSTQVASSDANCLDDYEEGTWTPSYTLQAGSVSGVSVSGTYVKIGKQVTVVFYIGFTTASSARISAITGLPFTVSSTTEYPMGVARENAATGLLWQLRPSAADTQILIRRYDNGDNLSSGFAFYGSATYFV